MKASSLTTCAVAALLLIAPADSTRAASNCEEILGDNLYRCQVKQEAGAQFENCSQFVSSGGKSSKFDLVIDGAFTFGCTCRAKGSIKKPKFNASKEFLCVASNVGEAIVGKVSGNGAKIKGGFLADETGPSVIIECVLDPTCASPS